MTTAIGLDLRVRETPDLRASGAVADEVAARMDRLPLTRLHLAVLAVGTLGFSFDLMEVALGNVLSAVFRAEPYALGARQLSWLLSAMYLGAIVGAPLAGWLADAHGRRRVMSGVLALLAVASVFAAASPDASSLIAARVASGLALGAYPPLLISVLTDLMPPRQRGRAIMVVAGLAALGPVAAVFLVRWLTPIAPLGIEAWRWAFLVGAAGAAVVAFGILRLPESPRWLAARGRGDEALAVIAAFDRSPALLAGGGPPPTARGAAPGTAARPDGRRFAVFAGLYFLAPWAVVAFPLMMGAVLIEKGFNLSDSLLYVGIAMLGPVVGTIAAAFVVDRIERRTALAALAVLMILSATAFAAAETPGWLMAAALAFSITGQLYVPTLTIHTAESFPTAWRARTGAGAWAINRVASALSPLLLLPLLTTTGVWAMFSVMIGAVGLGLVLVLAWGDRGRAGQGIV